MRSMFTAINALYVHQEYMDVVSDNLANVNTPGFKSSYMTFKDQYAQTLRTGSAPSDTLGGVNPIQIGLGAIMGTVSPTFTQGALQSTGRQLDLAIQGEGFFIFDNGNGSVYSRDGSLAMDADGYLVNSSSGMRLQGWQANKGTGELQTGVDVSSIQVPIDSSVAQQTENVNVTGNITSTANRSYNPPDEPLGSYDVTFKVYDSLGNDVPVTLRYVRTNETETTPLEWRVYRITDTTVGKDANGYPDTTTGGATLLSAYNAVGDVLVGDLTFNSSGQPSPAQQYVETTVIGSAGSEGNTTTPATGFNVRINLTGMTMLNSSNSAAASYQDGLAGGSLNGFVISDTDGKIYGSYSNGSEQLIGQIALASFTNPAGLVRQGNNTYTVGLNSGLARISMAGDGGKGTIVSGYTEGSNTDMSREFSDMILAQRGFQASSRIITTADQMLQELVNLKR